MNKEKIFHLFSYIFPLIMIIFGAIILNMYDLLGKIKWLIIGGLVLLYLLFSALFLLGKKKKSKGLILTACIFSVLLGLGTTACDYLYYRAINTMQSISTNIGDVATSSLYVKSDSEMNTLNDLVGKRIAVQPESSVTMYQMLIEGIAEKGLKQEDFILEPYTSYYSAYEDFLDGNIDAILLDTPAYTMISETYPEIATSTKVIESFKKIIMNSSSGADNKDLSSEPFTILINGVDTRSGDLNDAANADVIMLATFNPKTLKLTLNSIPRDTYLYVPCRGFYDKVTHSGVGGVDCTIDTLEQTFDIDIDYYIKINFFAVVDLVDALGGIEVDVPMSFSEQDAHGNYDVIQLEKGLQTLNGEEALALSRHRKTLLRGDIDRGLNQQLVIEAILKKVASSSAVLNVDKLLSVVGNNVQTNIPLSQMTALFNLLTKISTESRYGGLSQLSIAKNTIEGYGFMTVPAYYDFALYFYGPYEYSLANTTRDINRINGTEDYPLPTSTFAFNANVPYEELSEEAIDYMDNDPDAIYTGNYDPVIYYVEEEEEETYYEEETTPEVEEETPEVEEEVFEEEINNTEEEIEDDVPEENLESESIEEE